MADPYQAVTQAILAQLDDGPGVWTCPWHRARGGLPQNALTGRPYRGINTLTLWCRSQVDGHDDQRWATYRQWLQLGAQVRKGEQGTTVLFFKSVEPAADADEPFTRRFVARASSVFNVSQVSNPPVDAAATAPPAHPMPIFDRFVAATGVVIRPGPNASYLRAADEIRMPDRACFVSDDGYRATLAHELVHWTGAKRRLDRDLSVRFRSEAYAGEELVAELGAAFVLAQLGLAPEPHPQHAAYMASWLPLVRADPRALVTAASHAGKAASFLEALTNPSSEAAPPVPVYRLRVPIRPSRAFTRGSRLHSHGW